MSKSGSRYGRRSNWFKIHCLLQEQANGAQTANANSGTGSPFGAGFLPGYLPQTQNQQASPSQEDLAIQSHLLHMAMLKKRRKVDDESPLQDDVAMLKKRCQVDEKTPHPDDVALQNQLRLLAWQKERERVCSNLQQPPTTPPRDTTPLPFYKQQQQHSVSPMFPMNFAQKDACVPSSPPDVFRPFLPVYKRSTDSPTDSGSSSVDGDGDGEGDGDGGDGQDTESRSNSALSYFKASAASPTLSERDFPPRKFRATVTLTTGYHPHHSLGLIYPPPGLITPAASQHSPRGGDLLLVSPSPGGLAVEQDEPIDLSIRSTRSSPRPSQLSEDDNRSVNNVCKHNSPTKEEATAKSKPLDLRLGVRPAELPLSL
ncbi:uncharacterized protein LOC144478061 [Augochlora pura]